MFLINNVVSGSGSSISSSIFLLVEFEKVSSKIKIKIIKHYFFNYNFLIVLYHARFEEHQ